MVFKLHLVISSKRNKKYISIINRNNEYIKTIKGNVFDN